MCCIMKYMVYSQALRTVAQQQQGGRTLPEAAWPELALEEAVHGKVLLCRLDPTEVFPS